MRLTQWSSLRETEVICNYPIFMAWQGWPLMLTALGPLWEILMNCSVQFCESPGSSSLCSTINVSCFRAKINESVKFLFDHSKHKICYLTLFTTSNTGWYFCLWPSAKDQGITWALLVLVHHLVHFLLKINWSEKNSSLPGNWTGVL